MLLERISVAKLLPKIWGVSQSASEQALESKWNLLCSSNTTCAGIRERLWGAGQIPITGQTALGVFTLWGSLCVLDRGGQRLTASFMSFKSSCAQIHLTTSEVGIVHWEAVDTDEEFRKKPHQVTGCTSAMLPALGQHSSFMFRMASSSKRHLVSDNVFNIWAVRSSLEPHLVTLLKNSKCTGVAL